MLFGWGRRDYLNVGVSIFSGVDVSRFEDGGAVRVLFAFHADSLRDSRVSGVFEELGTMDTLGGSFLIGDRMR